MTTQNLDLSLDAAGNIVWKGSKGDRIILSKEFQKAIWELVEREMTRELLLNDERVIRDAFFEENFEEIVDNFIVEKDSFLINDNFITLLRLALLDTQEDLASRQEDENEAKYFESFNSGEESNMIDALFAGVDEDDYSAY